MSFKILIYLILLHLRKARSLCLLGTIKMSKVLVVFGEQVGKVNSFAFKWEKNRRRYYLQSV